MKKWVTAFFPASFLLPLAAPAQTASIVARMTNVRNDKGVCQVCLFDRAEAFRGDGQPVQCLSVPVKGGRAEAVFTNVAAGTYAVLVFHDANTNKKLDTNFFGIPREGYGASRNALPFAAAPGFEANKFTVAPGASVLLSIRLRNL